MQSIILITDSFPSANGGGISQTLFNLLDQWQSSIYIVSRSSEKISEGPELAADQLSFKFESFGRYNRRFLRLLNPAINIINFNRQQQLKTLSSGWPTATESWVLVSTTEPIKLHFAWLLQQRFGYTVIPYFMDDWLAENKLTWKGGNIQDVAKDILKAAPCWLMISRQLEATLRKRYGLDKKPCLVVHNPAPDLTGDRLHLPALTADSIKHSVAADQAGMTDDRGEEETQSRFNVESGGQHQLSKALTTNSTGTSDRHLSPVNSHLILYAGSIWPMHADALIATAKAVHGMQGYKLIVYTGEAHWKKYRSQIEGPGITYGGWKPYNEIHEALQDAWLLLCTASFQDQYKAFSDSSVQTKLTDYMAVGKPVLFVGPADAASGVFVEEQDIGFTMGTNQPADIAARLDTISRMPAVWERKAGNGRELAASTFSKSVVQQKLYDFLERYALPSHEESVFS